MEALLSTALFILIFFSIAVVVTAVYIFVTVFKRQRKFRKDFDNRWNNHNF